MLKEQKKRFRAKHKRSTEEPLTIDILSVSNRVAGQGVGSAFVEQSELVRELDDFSVKVNSILPADIIHCHSLEPSNFVRMKARGEISVVHCHFLPETLEGSIHLPHAFAEIYKRYVIEFYRAADWIVVVNPIFIEPLVGYGIRREKIRYIPNYVSSKTFYAQRPETIAQNRERLGIGKDRFVVMSAGQTQTRKGVLDFAELARRMPEAEFIWCGGFSFGPLTDGYHEIAQLIHNPPPNVRFTGIIPREQMNDYYNLADVFFMPSYQELFPMCVLEAAAVGKPLLLRDLELYRDILFGNYLSGDSVEGFAQAMERLQNDPETRRTTCAWSSAIHEFYSPEAVQRQWKDFYQSISAERNVD